MELCLQLWVDLLWHCHFSELFHSSFVSVPVALLLSSVVLLDGLLPELRCIQVWSDQSMFSQRHSQHPATRKSALSIYRVLHVRRRFLGDFVRSEKNRFLFDYHKNRIFHPFFTLFLSIVFRLEEMLNRLLDACHESGIFSSMLSPSFLHLTRFLSFSLWKFLTVS